ncbi:MAG: phosphatase PAP2 family protein [Stomatobaculum longum]|jgi:ser/thr and tyr protein phosphatase (dual specificity)|uniref:phosphatase PAP2 family protein n=1 Tax=Stomatobaculum longum TaxID=796942 RepID=UPI001CB64C10|nr:phosphatase PAP2 family protein [Stomatobaculum longum]MBF1256060.1 phosphatase PAP2 family protein [Stomatobaculum longum]
MGIQIKVLLAEILLLGLQTLLYFGVEAFEGKPHNVAKKIDGHIPFVPAFVYIYVLWFPLILLFPLALFRANPMAYARYQTAILLDIALSLVCYLVYPTSFARPEAPDTVSGRAMKLVFRGSYKGLNCAPSMHCSMCYLVLHFVGATPGLPPAVAAIAVPVALGIVISTLFTKQHVLIDALTALPLAAVCILIGNRLPFTALLHWILGA